MIFFQKKKKRIRIDLETPVWVACSSDVDCFGMELGQRYIHQSTKSTSATCKYLSLPIYMEQKNACVRSSATIVILLYRSLHNCNIRARNLLREGLGSCPRSKKVCAIDASLALELT